MSRGDVRFGTMDAGIALVIFAIALTLRLVVLTQIQQLPSLDHFIGDAAAYDAWAHRIVAGDWWGQEVFYQAPAYPYWLAILHLIGGHDAELIHRIQMVLGALSCVFIFVATRLLFDRPTGAVAGLLMAAYAPAIFYDSLVQKTGLGLFLLTVFLTLLIQLQRRAHWLPAFAAGIVLGALTLTRENTLAFLPAIPIWMALRFRESSTRDRTIWVATFALGVVLVLVPVGLRNYAVGDTFAITTSQLGTNFYIGNNPDATGIYAPLLPGRETAHYESPDAQMLAERALGRPLEKGEVSRYWLGRGLEFAAAEPLRWLGLFFFKGALALSWLEIPDSEDIYVHAEASALLRCLLSVLHFGTLLPLAAAGILLVGLRRRDTTLLIGLASIFLLTLMTFYVFGRYRYPLVPLFLPLAAFACVEIARRLRARRFSDLAAPLVVLSFVGAAVNTSPLEEMSLRAVAYMNFGGIMIEEQRYDEAEVYLLRALELNPNYADLEFHLAVLRLGQGRGPAAERHLRRVLQLAESNVRAHLMLAELLEETGHREEAVQHRKRAVEIDPSTRVNLERLR